ncbi:MAG: right-handed parallel beta-helix repeat-containing protein [Proteobacteria bacterium]|nr:right-handed parallel beta-helix repeat-containing protein [Pseudomonadota bacterium]
MNRSSIVQLFDFADCAALHLAIVLLAACALLSGRTAHALETYCVASTDELDYAYRRSAYDDVEIHLVQGYYNLKDSALDVATGYYPNGQSRMTLRGGYTPGCAGRTAKPDVTRLSIERTPGFVRFGSFGDLLLESLKIYLTDSVILWSTHSLTLRNDRFEGNRASATATNGLEAVYALGPYVRVEQSLFDKNSAPGCALLLDTDSTLPYSLVSAEVVNSVFADNTGPGLCVRKEFSGGSESANWSLSAFNNILWNNGGIGDLVTRGSNSISLFNNIYHTTSMQPSPAAAATASIDADPQFADPVNANYFIKTTSPAVNSGSVVQPGGFPATDLIDDPRIVGSRIDRGAYETIVDDGLYLTVTSTLDPPLNPPTGTLRRAIADANAAGGFHAIRFNLPGPCSANVIHLALPLPDITQNLRIDGYSQAGSSPNSSPFGNNAVPCVGIVGDGSNQTHALRVPSGGTATLEVNGIAFGGFTTAALRLSGGSGHNVWGNQFGGSLGATALGNNAVNVLLDGSSSGSVIGGSANQQQNLLNGAYQYGVQIAGGSGGNQIQGNYVGMAANGRSFASNGTGIFIATDHNVITGNFVSGNNYDGIEIAYATATDNVLLNNRVGVIGSIPLCGIPPLPACTPGYNLLPNGRFGVLAHLGANHAVMYGNEIAGSGDAGVYVANGSARIDLLVNSIHDNTGLGIDLGVAGVDPVDNDGAAAAAAYANRGLNRPYIGIPRGGQHRGTVTGALASINGDYLIQAFASNACAASGYGEGQWYVGSASASIGNQSVGGNGSVVFSVPLSWSSGNLADKAITLIARDALGNTSEFSQCSVYQCDTIFANGFDDAIAQTCPAH